MAEKKEKKEKDNRFTYNSDKGLKVVSEGKNEAKKKEEKKKE